MLTLLKSAPDPCLRWYYFGRLVSLRPVPRVATLNQ